MRSLLLLVSLCGVLAVARPSHAGICLDDSELADYVKELELHAKGGPPPSEYWSLCLLWSDKFQPQVVKPCRKLVQTFDPDKEIPFDEANPLPAQKARTQVGCIYVLARAGVINVGKIDTVAHLMKGVWGPSESIRDRVRVLVASGDARVKPFLIEKTRENLAKVATKPPRKSNLTAWNRWQIDALWGLAKQGEAADVALIDELLAATKDKRVRKAAEKARAEIAARAP